MSATGPTLNLIGFLQKEIEDRRWIIIRAHDEIKAFTRALDALDLKRKEIEETYGAHPELVDQIAANARAPKA